MTDIPLSRFLSIQSAYGPTFSPDSRRLAFLSNITGGLNTTNDQINFNSVPSLSNAGILPYVLIAGVDFGTNLLFFVLVVLLQIALDERRIHRPRSDAVHSDLSRVFYRNLLGQRHHRPFGGAVCESLLDTY